MDIQADKVLDKIRASVKGSSAIVVKRCGKEKSILFSSGKLDVAGKNIASLINFITAKKKISASDVIKSKQYKSFSAEAKVRSLHADLFLQKGKENYFLILFFKEKVPAKKFIEQKISSNIELLKQNILKDSPKEETASSTQTLSETEIVQTVRELVNGINVVLYSTSPDGMEFNFVTEAVRTLFGYSPEEIYEYKYRTLKSIHPSDFIRFKHFINKLRNKEEAVVVYRMKDRFSKEHWVRHSGIPLIKNNEIIRVVGVIQEITEEKNTQLRLEKSEERFRMLIDTAEDLIFVLDGFGYFSMVNKSGAAALGYIPEEMIGRHFLEFIDKEDEGKIAESFNRILTTEGITTFETVFLDRFDKGITFEVNAQPMISNGEVTGMLSFGRNISKRKLDEQKIRDLNSKLIEANRIISIERERAKNKITILEEINKLKSEFISNVSHELRTPLASIVGFAETIVSDSDLPKDMIYEFCNIILQEGNRLAKLINDILDFSRLESGEEELQKSDVSIRDLIDETLQNFDEQIKAKQLVISKEYPEVKFLIKADKERISKAFYNLISNAVKYTGNGGRISVILQDFGKEIEIAVSDTGVGIREQDIPTLFQKFNKIEKSGMPIGGTGFGLVSVKQIVDLHKGFIKVRSQVNKGTTFIIRLPK